MGLSPAASQDVCHVWSFVMETQLRLRLKNKHVRRDRN